MTAAPARGTAPAPRALVVTVVHHPEDARIRHRQIGALLDAGWQVTYAAPFAAHGVTLTPVDGLTTVDLPRASGRDRLRAARAARRLVRRLADAHDVVLVHDPELVPAIAGLARGRRVWDVHEDPAAALVVKEWLPRPLRPVVGRAWRLAERRAERGWHLLLAEHAYQDRFRRTHPVVANTATVPEEVVAPGRDRVVYLGNVTLARGAAEMAEVGRILHEATGGEVTLHVVGPARDEATRRLLEEAASAGHVILHGFVPAADAGRMLDGALAGVSLLHDLPNYRPSMPTKVVEYLAHGIPVVTTPLPLAVELVEACDGGVVVPFEDAEAAAAALLALHADPARAAAAGRRGHDLVRERYDWGRGATDFVAELARVAGR